ncbi:MAG TPA: hypothetical protein VGH02_03715 [Rhizomicrobium sp.]
MSEWPAKLEITAEQFDSMDGDALFERIGPWSFGALVDKGRCPSRVFQLTASGYWIWTEAANGGIEQYFTNGAIGAEYIPEVLDLLGRGKAIPLFELAAAQIPKGYAGWDLDDRWNFASENPVINGISDEFWNFLDDATFAKDFAVFVRQHRFEFEPFLKSESGNDSLH